MTILAVSVLMYLVTSFGEFGNDLIRYLAQINVLVEAGEWWRIFTPVLLHASITHILFNMWALYVLGPQVERAVGSRAFLGLYLAAAGMGGVAYFYMAPGFAPAVGASGAIFGLFGVWLAWALRRRQSAWGRAMLGQLGFLLLINAALPFMIGGIAWQAHLGGLVAGFAIGIAWGAIQGKNVELYRTLVAFAVAALAALLVLI